MPSKLGIVAGGGNLPLCLVEACRGQGRELFVLVLQGHGNPQDFQGVPHAVVRLGAAAKGFSLLKQAGVGDVVMAGPVRRPTLRELRPDWQTAAFFARIGLKSLGDDGLLKAVMHEIEKEGFRVVGVDDVAANLLAPEGLWTAAGPDSQAQADIERGIEVANGLGLLDVGQSVVVQQGIVLGVEAVEGTDALIARCGDLRRAGAKPVLIKRAKPGQDRRADLPTIGEATIKNARSAGFAGLAVEAGATLVVGHDAIVAAADDAGMFVLGVGMAGR